MRLCHLLLCHQSCLHQHISEGFAIAIDEFNIDYANNSARGFAMDFGELDTADANISTRDFTTYLKVINYAYT